MSVVCTRCGHAHWRGTTPFAVVVDRRVVVAHDLCPPCLEYAQAAARDATKPALSSRSFVPFAGSR